jgi:hypothetical protein
VPDCCFFAPHPQQTVMIYWGERKACTTSGSAVASHCRAYEQLCLPLQSIAPVQWHVLSRLCFLGGMHRKTQTTTNQTYGTFRLAARSAWCGNCLTTLHVSAPRYLRNGCMEMCPHEFASTRAQSQPKTAQLNHIFRTCTVAVTALSRRALEPRGGRKNAYNTSTREPLPYEACGSPLVRPLWRFSMSTGRACTRSN